MILIIATIPKTVVVVLLQDLLFHHHLLPFHLHLFHVFVLQEVLEQLVLQGLLVLLVPLDLLARKVSRVLLDLVEQVLLGLLVRLAL
jgi:hypothetical protein